MCCLLKLWRDDGGFVLSSEMVLVGTVGVIGASVGLSALATAANEELEDVAFALRSLDQSYEIAGIRGCGGWTAGSSFQQEPVAESLCDLEELIDRHEKEAEKKAKERDDDDDKPATKPQPKKPGAKKPAAEKDGERDEETSLEVVL